MENKLILLIKVVDKNKIDHLENSASMCAIKTMIFDLNRIVMLNFKFGVLLKVCITL